MIRFFKSSTSVGVQLRILNSMPLERQQYELNSVQGQKNLAMPLHFRGHYHQLAQNEQPDAQLRNFFSEKFANAYSCEDEQCQQRGDCEQCEQIEQQQREDAQELEDQQMRQQSLHSFISAYKPRQQYKHSLKMVAQTNGGAKDAKAQGDIQAMCDEQTAYCKVLVKVERPPIGNENQKWMLNAQAHVLMPETAASVEQLQTQPKQLKQFIAQAKAQWGQQGQQTQQVNIRVHGAQAHTQQVRAVLQQQQGNQLISAQHLRNMQRRSAFLNKFQIEVQHRFFSSQSDGLNVFEPKWKKRVFVVLLVLGVIILIIMEARTNLVTDEEGENLDEHRRRKEETRRGRQQQLAANQLPLVLPDAEDEPDEIPWQARSADDDDNGNGNNEDNPDAPDNWRNRTN
ncbi:hypothetical protein niasHT_030294 [Heterodera trifolii]|uniref:Uncharacterized protein n=1 Tax=Heterodera trifolii TaxID=157864 RepID=A0ABD2KP71_9BILA